jgi:hypothetical protein
VIEKYGSDIVGVMRLKPNCEQSSESMNFRGLKELVSSSLNWLS